MITMSVPNQARPTKQGELAKGEPSVLLTTCFAGMGTGFMTFWLTLTLLYSGVLCMFGAPLVWFFVRDMNGTDLANTSTIIFLVSALIGMGVGFASSFGSGVPVSII